MVGRLPREWLVVLSVVVLVSPVSSEDCPELVGRWPYGPAVAVAAFSDFAYFLSGPSLMVADLTDPSSPHVLGEWSLPDGAFAVAAEEGFAYVLTQRNRLGERWAPLFNNVKSLGLALS